MNVSRLISSLLLASSLNGCFSSDSWTNSFFQKAVVATSVSGNFPTGGVPVSTGSPELSVVADSIEQNSGGGINLPSVYLNEIGEKFPIQIRNVGTAPLEIQGLGLYSGNYGDSSQFKLTVDIPNQILPNEAVEFYVSFRPKVQDWANARIQIFTNDSDESSFTLWVAGNATPVSDISVTMGNSNIESGQSVEIGSGSCVIEKNFTFTIKNLGLSSLELTGTPFVNVEGADSASFSISSQPGQSILPSGQSANFTVKFFSSAAGQKNVTLRIPNNDPDEGDFTFSLLTTPGSPEISVSKYSGSEIPLGSKYDLGYYYINSTGLAQLSLTVKNQGDSVLFLTGSPLLSFSGANANLFSFTYPVSTIAAGSEHMFLVFGKTTTLGNKSATLSLPNDDCDENPYTLDVEMRGYDYSLITDSANWSARRGHTSVVFNDQIWVFGGVGTGYYKDVYSSSSGSGWTLKTSNAPWGKRAYHSSVVFKNKIWILGGDEALQDGTLDHSIRNDIWSSSDGVNWTREVATAPWTGRLQFAAVVFDDKIWVLGGKSCCESLHDVWNSSDGINWNKVTDTPGWSARSTFPGLVYQNKLWVIGGFSQAEGRALSDVWNSSDGLNWTKVTDTPGWGPHTAHTAVVYNNAMYILSGYDGHNVILESYRSEDGIHWSMFYSPWGARDTQSAFVWKDKIWTIGGQGNPGYLFRSVTTFWDY